MVTPTGGDFELVLVSYRSRRNVEALLAGLHEDQPVAVVDNAADDDGLRTLIEGRPHGRYLPGGGVGFARAANLGARTSSHEHLVFGNPDTRPTAHILEALVDGLVGRPDVISCSANLVDANGRPELGVAGWEPSVRRAFVHACGLHKVFPRAGLFARLEPSRDWPVDWVSGACMAVRREDFLAVGGFDETFYLYNEDVSFGRRAREGGYQQAIRSNLLVPHGSGSSGAPSLEMMRLRGAALSTYLEIHHGRAAADATVLILVFGYACRALHQRLTGRTGRAREHWSYVRGLVSRSATVAGEEVVRARLRSVAQDSAVTGTPAVGKA